MVEQASMEISMLKIVVYATLFTFSIIDLSSAQGVLPNDVPMLPVIESSGAQSQPDAIRPRQTLLTEIVNWLSANFDLPAIQDHPNVQFVSPAKLASMRYQDEGVLADRTRETGAYEPVEAAHHREAVALYEGATRTIFLSNIWTGTTAADQSVLVHEMVHHLQNLGKLKFECPMAREKLAYMAQDRWLKRFGKDLETEFEVDMFTILVSSACMY
jgi:Domain of unknown function (DUF6647)